MSQVHANVFSGFKHATPVAVLVQAVRLVLAVIEYDDADRYFVTDRRPKRLVAEIQRAITGQTRAITGQTLHFLIGITDLDGDRDTRGLPGRAPVLNIGAPRLQNASISGMIAGSS